MKNFAIVSGFFLKTAAIILLSLLYQDVMNSQDPLVPNVPGELNSMALSAVAVKLTWTDLSDNETGFVIERKDGNDVFHYVDSVENNVTTYMDVNLSANTGYQYRIKALNDYGESSYSNETAVKTYSDDFLSNVSRYKTATQSSTIYGGVASRAIDGNTNGYYANESVTHTDYELHAWWEVDLEDVYNINYIEVWNRTDTCCKDRMAGFNLFVSEDPFESHDLQTTMDQPGVWSVYEDRYPEPMVRFHVSRRGRYIRLQLSDSEEICLAELVAMGSNHLDPPEFITSPGTEGMQEQEYSYLFDASDPNEDSLVFTVIQKPAWLVFDPVTRSLVGTPLNADTGNHQIILRVYDGLYHVDQSFTLHIENANEPPVIVSDPLLEIAENETYSYTVEVEDPDNDLLTLEIVQKPVWLEYEASTWTLSGIPGTSDVGTHEITIRVSDGELTDEQTFQITVIDFNNSPSITSEPITEIEQGSAYSYLIIASDPDEDTLTITVTQKPDWLAFDSTTNTLSGVPAPEDVGTTEIIIIVFDGSVEISQIFQLTVIDLNDLPQFVSEPVFTVYQDANYGYNFLAEDPDGDPLTYTAAKIPDWLTFDIITLTIRGIPANEDVGIHDVTLRVSDGKGHTDQPFQITVINVNDLPEFTSTPPDKEVYPDSLYEYLITVEEVDVGDVLTFSIEALPGWLTLTPGTDQAMLRGTPSLSDVGSHPVTISVSDGIGTVTQDFTIEVLDPTVIYRGPSLVDRIYPIPADERVYFTFSMKGDVVLKLYDITGMLVREARVENSHLMELDLTGLSENLYFYRVAIGERTSFGKLIKE